MTPVRPAPSPLPRPRPDPPLTPSLAEFYAGNGTKKLTSAFQAIPSGTCTQGQAFKDAQACFDAIEALGFNATHTTKKTASDPKMPAGCVLDKNPDGSATALFNTGGSGSCASADTKEAASSSPKTKVKVGISLAAAAKQATITLSGPAGAWFGVGFNAMQMEDQPYTIVVNSTGVTEHKIGTCGTEADHCAGTPLATSVKVVSNTVENSVRTVVLSRAFAGASKDHYTFDPSKVATLNYISAVGGSQAFEYHVNKDSRVLSFTPPTGPTCVCNLGESGELCWNQELIKGDEPGTPGYAGEKNAGTCDNFKKNCVARSPKMGAAGTPASGDLLFQRNPTCNSGQYVGGLTCCKHKRIMLDADQPVPDELLRYHMKFRFWYQV